MLIYEAGVGSSHLPFFEGEYHLLSKGWAEMILKVYELDPLRYPACGGPISHQHPSGRKAAQKRRKKGEVCAEASAEKIRRAFRYREHNPISALR